MKGSSQIRVDTSELCKHCDFYNNGGKDSIGRLVCSEEDRKRYFERGICLGSSCGGVRLDSVTIDIITLSGKEYIRPSLEGFDDAVKERRF